MLNGTKTRKKSSKPHPSQLIRILRSISDIVHKTDEFESVNNFIKPWKPSCKIKFQIERSKETAKSSYYSTLSKIQSINADKSQMLLYIEGSKTEFSTSAVFFLFFYFFIYSLSVFNLRL